MSNRASLIEELQGLIHRLFRFPPLLGRVTDPEEAAVIGRIGIIRRLLARSDD